VLQVLLGVPAFLERQWEACRLFVITRFIYTTEGLDCEKASVSKWVLCDDVLDLRNVLNGRSLLSGRGRRNEIEELRLENEDRTVEIEEFGSKNLDRTIEIEKVEIEEMKSKC
jgi:hypothetical protein